jgi:hypothetical protein
VKANWPEEIVNKSWLTITGISIFAPIKINK